jgi:hypothetical protein
VLNDLIKRRAKSMRPIAFILALFLAGPAAADWKEYEYPDYSFTVHFPADPKIEIATYQAGDGGAFEARIYSVTQDTGVFKLTIADPPDGTDENTLIGQAVKSMTEGGVIKFDIPHRIRTFYGRQLGIAGADGGYSYVAVFYHKKRLYQIEGKAFVAGGHAEVDAMIFQQSLDLPE